MCGVYYSIMCTNHPYILSAFFLCHPYIPLSNLKNLLVYIGIKLLPDYTVHVMWVCLASSTHAVQ